MHSRNGARLDAGGGASGACGVPPSSPRANFERPGGSRVGISGRPAIEDCRARLETSRIAWEVGNPFKLVRRRKFSNILSHSSFDKIYTGIFIFKCYLGNIFSGESDIECYFGLIHRMHEYIHQKDRLLFCISGDRALYIAQNLPKLKWNTTNVHLRI